MKLAEVQTKDTVVTMHYNEKIGYSVTHHDATFQGHEFYIPTREAAEQSFLWVVGYPEWQLAASKAYKEARDTWLKNHTSLASVGAKDLTP